MTRAFHATTASGDAVTLEANADSGSHGRMLAQLEHNAMQALGLTRAARAALQPIARGLERASLLLARCQGQVEPGLRPELQRVFAEIVQHTRHAEHAGHALLDGSSVAYALENPWLESSQPVKIELPNLAAHVFAPDGLANLDVNAHPDALAIAKRLQALQHATRQSQTTLQRAAQQLANVLIQLRRDRNASPNDRNQDKAFVDLIGRVRDEVLRSGPSALRVQGAPSTRAAWLVESSEEIT